MDKRKENCFLFFVIIEFYIIMIYFIEKWFQVNQDRREESRTYPGH